MNKSDCCGGTLKSALVFALCGAPLGAAITAIFLAVAIPHHVTMLLPVSVAEELDRMILWMAPFGNYWQLWGLLSLAGLWVAWALVLKRVNPDFPCWPYRTAAVPWRAWAAYLGSGVAALLGLWLIAQSSSSGELGIGGTGSLTTFGSWMGTALGAAVWGAACAAAWTADKAAAGSPYWTRETWREARPGLAWGFVWGAALAGLLYAVSRETVFLMGFVADALDGSLEPSLRGMLLMAGGLIVISALSYAIAGLLAPAFARGAAAGRERLLRAKPGLILAAASLAAWGLLYAHAVYSHDWGVPTLAQAAGIREETSAPMTVVLLGNPTDRDRGSLYSWPMTVHSWGGFSHQGTDIPATEATSAALRSFMKGRGAQSRFRDAALTALFSIPGRHWDQEGALRAHEGLSLAGYRHHSYLWIALRAAWLTRTAPATKANKEFLSQISDSGDYRIVGRWAAHIARGWGRFGEMKKAKEWLEKARAGGAEASALEEAEFYQRGALTEGRVRGKVAMDGRPQAKIKVGLFHLPRAEKYAGSPPSNAMILPNLVEAQWAGKDGSFSFAKLPRGRYYLGFLLSSSDLPSGNFARAPGHPGVMELSTGRPSADAGTVRLSRITAPKR